MKTPLIELQRIVKSYPTTAGTQEILRGVDLAISAGEFIALMGSSGAGKSTLMNILGCLDWATTGKYLWNGQDVTALNGDQQAELRNRAIGFVFQGFNLLPQLTLEENVALPMKYARVNRSESQQRARQLLEQLGVGARYQALPSQVSGGEQQRAAIARALANHPQLIVADEPTGSLDLANSRQIMEIFAQLHQAGVTIFLVTHEPTIAAYAERQLRLVDGSLTELIANHEPTGEQFNG